MPRGVLASGHNPHYRQLCPFRDLHDALIDTSPDFERERFSGHLKVSMTEFLITLRDEANWLEDEDTDSTLYPTGFSAAAFARAHHGRADLEEAEHLALCPH